MNTKIQLCVATNAIIAIRCSELYQVNHAGLKYVWYFGYDHPKFCLSSDDHGIGMMRAKLLPATTVCTVFVYGCGESPCPDNLEDFNREILGVVGIGGIDAFDRNGDNTPEPVEEYSPVIVDSLELDIDINLAARDPIQQSAGWSLVDIYIKAASACSPQLGYIDFEIVGMQLISTASLGSEIGPGTSHAGVFAAEEIVRDKIEYDFNDFQDSRRLDEYTCTNPVLAGAAYVLRTSSVDIQLMPQATELHQFTYSIELATGEIFEGVSDGVLISSVVEQ